MYNTILDFYTTITTLPSQNTSLFYFVTGTLVFLNFALGIIVAYIGKEEVKSYAHVLIKLQDTIFLILILSTAYFNMMLPIIILIGIFILFYWYKDSIGKTAYFIEFLMIGILYGIIFTQDNQTIILGSILVLFNIITGILIKHKYFEKSKSQIFLMMCKRYFYFMTGSSLPFLFSQTNIIS